MKISNLTETIKHKEPLWKLVSSCLMPFKLVFYLGLAACLLSFAGAASLPVSAQAIPTLSFSPVPAVLDTRVANTTVVDVLISNAVNISGFDVQVDYDPNVASINQWVRGSFFPTGFCLPVLDIPGSLRLACTKTGEPGINGSGTLAKLTFEAMAWGGASVLNISKAELVESGSIDLVDVFVEPGELWVIPYYIALPLILQLGGPQSYQISIEKYAQASKLQAGNELLLALPGCAEVPS